MMLKLKLQYFGHLIRRVDSLKKTLMLGGIGGRRRRGRQRMRWLDGLTDSMDESEWTPGVGDGQGGLACCNSWGRKESDTTERLNWTELNWTVMHSFKYIITREELCQWNVCVCVYMKVKESEVTLSCPTLCNPMDCSLPGSSIHGVFQARILEWTSGVSFPFSLSLSVCMCEDSLIAQLVNNLPAIQETLVQFLGWENPLEKGQAIHSSILGLLLWLS